MFNNVANSNTYMFIKVRVFATVKMITWLAIIVVLGISLIMAQDDTCTRYGFDIDLPGASCADIYNKNPTSHGRSGYYVLKTDHLFFAYCDMELDCGGTKGGWI